MSYFFEKPEPLAVEIHRVATERLTHALDQLEHGVADDPATAVHTARKDLKKTRSILRLVRKNLGGETYRTENDRLREAAHLLAGRREADAKVEAVWSLLERAESELSAEAATALRAWHTALSGESGGGNAAFAVAGASALIEASRDASRLWELGQGGFELIAPGIKRAYKRGRSYMRRAIEDPSDETVHEWRKRVKDLWYSLRLVAPAWPAVLEAMAGEAHELSELLGDHHDLGEVRDDLELDGFGISTEAQNELMELVRDRQSELHAQAISIGERLYAEGPSRFVERLERWWHAWEAAQQNEQAGLPSS